MYNNTYLRCVFRAFIVLMIGVLLTPVVNAKSIREAVLDNLKDPDSARFGMEYKNSSMACIEVNAKNSYGGYAGKKSAILVKNRDSWVLSGINPISFFECKIWIDGVDAEMRNQIENKKEKRAYEAKLEADKKKNPNNRPIHRDLIADTNRWIVLDPYKSDDERKLFCAGWLASTIHQDIVYQYGLENRYSNEKMLDAYAENHPMMTDLRKIIKEVGQEKYEAYLEEKIKPSLKSFGEKVDGEVGNSESALGSRYKLLILHNKTEDICYSFMPDFKFIFFKKPKPPRQ